MAEKIRRYQRQTAAFCYQLALLAEFTEQMEQGECCDIRNLSELLESVVSCREAFLKAKTALGLAGGDTFIAPDEVYQFTAGFSLRNGRLEGDVGEKQVQKACLSWLAELPDNRKPTEAECVRYEVACLCLMLAGSSRRIRKRLCSRERFSLRKWLKKWKEKIRAFYLDEAYE